MIYLNRKALAAMAETAAWVARRRQRVRVVGQSMVPTLTDGQFVLVDPKRRPQVGSLALAVHPEKGDLLIIKRVESIDDVGRFVLTSDNPDAGTDSRQWGPLPSSGIRGTVTLILDQPFGLLT